KELNYKIQRRVPVFLYNSHNDFQQTNILPSLIGEGTGGFTEVFKNRVVTPFNGSYEDFRHVLHHELTHAMTFDLLYGNAFSALVSRRRLFQMPLWLAEGFAEYSSRHGWDAASDMWVRDATINGYLLPPMYLNGYNAYREGQALVKYIADKYGEKKLADIFRKGKIYLSINKALKKSIGIDQEKLWEEFSREMKRRYWPEIALRQEAEEIGTKLTKARKDGSYFNEKPVFSPEGDKIAMFTDGSDFTEIVLISADDGKILDRLVKSSRNGDLESLHAYVSGISFSPDGTKLVFVAKSHGKESLFFYDLLRNRVYKKKRFDFYNLLSPAWSPDGEKIAFSALKENERDIFVYYPQTDQLDRLMNDRYDDVDPSWYPESDRILFTSDRPHPQSEVVTGEEHEYVTAGAFMPGDFVYGWYNLNEIDLSNREVTAVDVGAGPNTVPTVSPDGSKIAFISGRSGIDNIYVAYTDSDRVYPVTNILSGIDYVSWSPDGKKLAFEAFNQGAFDVFILDEIVPVGDNGTLTPTAFAQGDNSLFTFDQSEESVDSALADVEDEPGEQPMLASLDPDENLSDDQAAASGDQQPFDSTMATPVSTEADSSQTADGKEDDEVITESGIYDEEYVHVSDGRSGDPLDPFMFDVEGDSSDVRKTVVVEEPPSFDSIAPPSSSGDYNIQQYKVKFTPDYVGGGFGYDTFFGLRGQTVFLFSDYLGNHQILVATDLVNTIDQSNVLGYYVNSKRRINYGVGLFHSKNFYLDPADNLFSDRFYGFQVFTSRPFSIFDRLELTASQFFIDREHHEADDTLSNRSSKVTTAEFSYVTDNIIWGLTGPLNGRRAKVTIGSGLNLFDSRDVEFYSAEFDFRQYWHFGGLYSLAFRASGGASNGRTPKLYFLGGTTNWIGNTTLDAKVYEVENLYFADVVTPLRGIDYYSLAGDRYGLINIEFRYPMIDYFAMRFPLALTISRVGGAIFLDMGSAWEGSNFKAGTTHGGLPADSTLGGRGSEKRLLDLKTGFGFGMRANLGFILLRYDIAWSTDFYSVSDKPTFYFSMGADF
ncbi:MAG: BamA/TamA family outer membrane protein, partial [candidate division Zixibacteria bacterium]|nr:BamA/TamA family outer membrane protein [candidate division Zixibacteria bacterium]